MKRLIAVLALVGSLCVNLTGCGNQDIGFTNYTFRHVHFSDTVESHCATIKTWCDNSSGIELKTEECGDIFLSEGTYILFDEANHCPFCKGE